MGWVGGLEEGAGALQCVGVAMEWRGRVPGWGWTTLYYNFCPPALLLDETELYVPPVLCLPLHALFTSWLQAAPARR